MEDLTEKFNKMTNELNNYIKNDNLSIEILKFIDNFECFEYEEKIKGYDFLKKIIFQFGVKNIELNFLGEPEIYNKEYELKIKKDNKTFSFIMIYDKDCDTLDYRFDVRNEEDYKIYEEIVYYYESFKDCKE
jgi:hypothetical protein